ncbi:hexokinase-domain-containing protein [Zychaea mexicana]|uniref:hexokinase-domain-containing protein n=1 Tax=Zychaea mexicana TaxID=64656 RepID=UPI0022FE6097|nr:hexokinase-domain-containing protein [Zychaea mexicana]KAI9484798.1 hexokinase-domain-containing protein [Zychaea mexicana]
MSISTLATSDERFGAHLARSIPAAKGIDLNLVIAAALFNFQITVIAVDSTFQRATPGLSLLKTARTFDNPNQQKFLADTIRERFRFHKHESSRPRVLRLLHEGNEALRILEEAPLNTVYMERVNALAHAEAGPLKHSVQKLNKRAVAAMDLRSQESKRRNHGIGDRIHGTKTVYELARIPEQLPASGRPGEKPRKAPKMTKRKPYQIVHTVTAQGFTFKRLRGWRQPVQTAMMIKARVKKLQEWMDKDQYLKSMLDILKHEQVFYDGLGVSDDQHEYGKYSVSEKKAPEAIPLKGAIGATPEQEEHLQKIVNQFTITPKYLEQICTHFISEMKKGLGEEGQTLAMIPSYVEGRLTGQEKGHFLALDLGGTNLRVVLVTLEGNGKYKTKSSKSRVTEELKTGPMRNLCDYIADCVDEFLTEEGLSHEETALNLGYTFSFPVLQSKINRGILKSWTKGFNCSGAVGKDPVMLLQDALLRKNVPVKVAALVNDAVGTLLSNAYQKPETTIGLILGTGSNGGYIEQMKNIGKWKGGKTTSPEMIINMEFGAFDNERRVLPVTPFDNKVDRQSINPNGQIFEKMVSGMYLGEVTRNVLLDMVDRELLFGPHDGNYDCKSWSKELSGHYAFETSHMSCIEGDGTSNLSRTSEVLDLNLNLHGITTVEGKIIKKVCEVVGTRAAHLAGAAIAAIVRHCEISPEEGTDVGIDGSLYEFYPSFESRIYDALAILLPEHKDVRKTVRLSLAKDGSGVGAALTACVAAQMENRKKGTIA